MLYLESLNISLHELMDINPEVYIIGEDIIDPYGGAFKVTKGLSTKYPDRVLSSPISEAAILGLSTGLAIQGFKPIVEIMFGDFITLCADQLVNGAAKFSWMYGDKFNVPIVLRTPMGGNRGYGATHSQSLEQIFLGIPKIFIVAPSLYHNVGNLLKNSVLEVKQPLLFIENKILYPMELKIDNKSKLVDDFHHKSINVSNKYFPTEILKTDESEIFDITIITYGGMAQKVLNAAKKKFIEDETSIQIIIPSLIKPIPAEDIVSTLRGSKNILIVEESYKYSGWGSELSCIIYENNFKELMAPINRLGSKEYPIPSSSNLEKNVLPQEDDILKKLNEIEK